MSQDVIRWDTQRDEKGVDGEGEKQPSQADTSVVGPSDGKQTRRAPFMGPPAFDPQKG